MDFGAELSSIKLKPAVIPDDPDKDDKPAVATIQITVENPSQELMGLLCQLANAGESIRVALSSYQLALR